MDSPWMQADLGSVPLSCAPSEPQFPHLLSGSLRPLWREKNVPRITSLGPDREEKRDGQGQGPCLFPVLSRPHLA